MSTRRIVTIAAIGALLTFTGCVRAPVVQLTGVRVGGLGLRGATLIAGLSIDNPNAFGIETDSIAFELESSNPGAAQTWTSVTRGTNRQQFRIEKRDTTVVEIPVEFRYAALSTPLRSLIDKGTFNYRLSGKVFVRTPLHRAVPFSQTGSLSL